MTTPKVSPAQMTRPRVIGLCGKAGAGKTTAGNWFVRNHKQSFLMSFARPIKRMAYRLLEDAASKSDGDIVRYLNEAKDEPIPFLMGITGRRLLQTLGTEWGRQAVHPDLWVAVAASKVEARLNAPIGQDPTIHLSSVFDDVRFENEADFIRTAGGMLLRIERADTGKPDETYEHASEEGVEPDMILRNDGTVDDLEAQLEALWPPTAHKRRK